MNIWLPALLLIAAGLIWGATGALLLVEYGVIYVEVAQ